MINSDLLAEIMPAIREVRMGWDEGRDNLCLTLEDDANKKIWVQSTPDSINIGLLETENIDSLKQIIDKHINDYEESDSQDGLYYTISFDGYFSDSVVMMIHDILLRNRVNDDSGINVKYEEF